MVSQISWDNVLTVLQKAFLASGRLILENFNNPEPVKYDLKKKNDLVTRIDRESEEIIIGAILRHFPHHQILAEEKGKVNPVGEEFLWVIDPLDGTTNFIQKIPHFGISAALLVRDQISFSIIFNPITGEMFHAIKGQGAWLNGREIRVSPRVRLEECLGATGFPFRTGEHLHSYLKIFKRLFARSRGIRRCGAAVLDLAYLACGRYDYFWETYLEPWDFLGGALLVLESGGLISDFSGHPLSTRPSGVIGANRDLYPLILKEVSDFDRR